MCRRDRRRRDRARRDRHRRSDARRPAAAARESCATRGSTVAFIDGAEAAAARAADPAVPQARPHRPAVRHLQVGDHARRPDRDRDRRLEVDLRRREPRAGRTAGGPRSTPSPSASAPRSPTTRCSPPAASAPSASRGGSSSTPRRGCRWTAGSCATATEAPVIVIAGRGRADAADRRADERRGRGDRLPRAREPSGSAPRSRSSGAASVTSLLLEGGADARRRLPRRRRDRRAAAVRRSEAARRGRGHDRCSTARASRGLADAESALSMEWEAQRRGPA